jgi:rhodanese-related sulfurtransferase
MDRGEDFDLLDVREPNEFQICRIQGATLIPLGELSRRTAELDPGRDLVVHCKVGARSAKAVALLQERGFTRVHNLKGGILAWIDRIDPSQSRYCGVRSRFSISAENVSRFRYDEFVTCFARNGKSRSDPYFLRSGRRRSDGPSYT